MKKLAVFDPNDGFKKLEDIAPAYTLVLKLDGLAILAVLDLVRGDLLTGLGLLR